MNEIPYIPEVLLVYLKKRYPLTDYVNVSDPAKMHRLHGRRDVIDFLEAVLHRQKAEAMTVTPQPR